MNQNNHRRFGGALNGLYVAAALQAGVIAAITADLKGAASRWWPTRCASWPRRPNRRGDRRQHGCHDRAGERHPPGDRQDALRDLRAARNTEPCLVQTCLRDTGDILCDLAMPIHVAGRHWCNVRVGVDSAVMRS